jgi:hypothetical protein
MNYSVSAGSFVEGSLLYAGCLVQRLGKALQLSWDVDPPFAVDLTGKYPCFVIVAEAEKGFGDRRLPIAADLAVVLLRTPRAQRKCSLKDSNLQPTD